MGESREDCPLHTYRAMETHNGPMTFLNLPSQSSSEWGLAYKPTGCLALPSPCLLGLKPRPHGQGFILGWIGRQECWEHSVPCRSSSRGSGPFLHLPPCLFPFSSYAPGFYRGWEPFVTKGSDNTGHANKTQPLFVEPLQCTKVQHGAQALESGNLSSTLNSAMYLGALVSSLTKRECWWLLPYRAVVRIR